LMELAHRCERGSERAADATLGIVRRCEAVDRYTRADQAGSLGLPRTLGSHAATAGRKQGLHPALGDARDDLAPIVTQVRLATDQHDLDHAKLGELIDER